jgi:hypothetical protein
MLRSSINTAGVLLLGASAFAQSNAHHMLRPITSPVKDAGVYHLGLGTWSHGVHTANITGPDIIYANTCPTTYYGGQHTNEMWVDEGRVPSTSGPVNAPDQNKGCQDHYTVNGFQIAYCTNGTVFSCNVGFQSLYTACAVAVPTSTFTLTGLPASNGSAQACWLVTIDLDATSQSFPLAADGTGSFFAPATSDLFGWSFTTTSPVQIIGGGTDTGPLISGAATTNPPSPVCSGVDGTRWDTLAGAPAPTWPANLTSGNFADPAGPEDGRGMDTQDQFRIDGPGATAAPGCYYFLGNPLGSFHLRLFANANCAAGQLGTDFCVPGVGGVIPCPCGNAQVPANSVRGCANGGGLGGTGGAVLTSSGAASLAADTAHFVSTGEQPTAFSILLQAHAPASPTGGVQFGQGVRCVSSNLKRLYIHPAVGGVVSFPQGADLSIHLQSAALGDTIVPGGYLYMAYYRDPNLWPACSTQTTNTFNASQSQAVTWTP